MKDKVIGLKNDVKAYVLDELDYNNRKFIFVIELDKEDNPIDDSYKQLELKIINDELIIDDIDDFEIASVVNNLFLSRMANEE